MKKLVLLALLFLAVPSQAQTAAEVLAAANAAQCEAVGLSAGCADAAHLAAWCSARSIAPCVDGRAAEEKIYSTSASYANAVLVPPMQRRVFEARRNEVVSRLVRIIQSDPVKCSAVMAAAGLPTDACK